VSASLIDDEEFGLSVVTGLPIQTYINDTDSRNRIKSTLNGSHVFYLNDKKRTVHVVVERVIMEGAGAIIAYGMKGNVRQGVIDIGGRTTDLFAANGQTPINHMCTGKSFGVELAADHLSANFQRLYGRPLRDDERRAILYAYPAYSKYLYPEIYVKQQQVTDLKVLARQAVDVIGDDIASVVSATWNESEQGGNVASSFARVLLVGGGAYFFHEHIKKIIPEVQIASQPEEANALGYAAFAEGQLQRHSNIRIA
jgi:plasmid segregation protein ParM